MSGGFGQGPLGAWPYGTKVIVPAPSIPSDLSSSRKIDGVTRLYLINDEGGFEAMDDVAQRVYLLLAYADKRQPIITPENNAARIARLTSALSILTTGREPVIRNLRVSIEDSGAGRLIPRVEYDRAIVNTQTTDPAPTAL